MPRMEMRDGGEVVLALEVGDRVHVAAGRHALTLILEADGALAAVMSHPHASPPDGGRRPVGQPPALAEAETAEPPSPSPDDGQPQPLTAAQATDEILSIFQQVNVKARSVKQQIQDTPEYYPAIDALKAEAMDRVADVCRRYLRVRPYPPAPQES